MGGEHADLGGAPQGPFARRFAQALDDRRFTLIALREALLARGEIVGLTTLSYWRSGERRPGSRGRELLPAVEEILGVSAGELRKLAPLRSPARLRAAAALDLENEGLERAIGETYAALGVDPRSGYRTVSSQAIATVHPDRRTMTIAIRDTVQALRDDVRDFPIIHYVPGGAGDSPPAVEGVSGLRFLHSHPHPDGEIFGFAYAFENPLRGGQMVLVEHTIRAPMVIPFAAIAVETKAREVLVQVRFLPGAEPDWMERVEGDPLHPRVQPIADADQSTALVIRRDFGPGTLGIRWEYDD